MFDGVLDLELEQLGLAFVMDVLVVFALLKSEHGVGVQSRALCRVREADLAVLLHVPSTHISSTAGHTQVVEVSRIGAHLVHLRALVAFHFKLVDRS